MRRVIVSGSRKLADSRPVDDALWAQARIAGGLHLLLVVHGAAAGTDTHAHNFCRRHNVQEERHVAQWEKYGKAAGVIRNGVMVEKGADACLVFPREGSKGTWDFITRAKKAGIPVVFG